MTKGKQWVLKDLPIDDVRVRKDFQFRTEGLNISNLNRLRSKLQEGGDKQALWRAYLAEGKHLDAGGSPRSAGIIAGELGYIYSRETIRQKLRQMGLMLNPDVEYGGDYKPWAPTAEELMGERVQDAEEALGQLGGLLVTLEEHDRARLLKIAKDLLVAIECDDDGARVEALRHLRGPILDI